MTSTPLDKFVTKENRRANNKTSHNKKDDADVSNDNNTKTSPAPSSSKDLKKQKIAKPKPFYEWTNAEVLKWLWRQFTEYHTMYGDLFKEHDVTGRTLMRMNDITLEKLGITDPAHREALWQEILKLRLKSDMLEMRKLQMKS